MVSDADRSLAERARIIESQFGHPGDRWASLQARVQAEAIGRFTEVQHEWLALMWCLDEYRRQQVSPLRMGNSAAGPAVRLAAIYRLKGNWFAELLSLLLQNRTSQVIRPRNSVRGFSQLHQIDLAWPMRAKQPLVDPLICVKSKVTGAPAYGDTPARGALSDFTNRRKELKFAATDLKLWRRQQDTAIEHWGAWREAAPPKTYFLWAARLRRRGRAPDDVNKLVREARALIDTYLEGAGVFAWEERNGRYEAVPLPPDSRVTELDDVLYRIASTIQQLSKGGRIPPPEGPAEERVETAKLAPDPPPRD